MKNMFKLKLIYIMSLCFDISSVKENIMKDKLYFDTINSNY